MAARFPRIWVRVLSLSLTVSSPFGPRRDSLGAGRVGRVAVGVCVVGVLFGAQIGFSGLVVAVTWARIAAILACRSGLSAGRGCGGGWAWGWAAVAEAA